MGFLETILRFIAFWLDQIIFPFIGVVYNLMIDIAETNIFTEEVIDLFASKVYALLGIFMLFKVSFSILTYIVNPDSFADKTKGFSKLISNVIITLTLLLFTPWIFVQAMDIQRIVLRDNIIGKIFSASGTSVTGSDNAGQMMAYETFKAFYYIDVSEYPACEGLEKGNDPEGTECRRIAFNDDEDYSNYVQTLNISERIKSVDIYLDWDLLWAKDANDDYTMTYIPIISSIAGGVVLLLLIVFCFDIAVRSVKLGFLRMVAPVPIVSRIDPKKGTEVFNKWVKVCVTTYLDLFVRLIAIYFAIFIVGQLTELRIVDAVTGLEKDVSPFLFVFILLGALMFAKQLPKLIEDITGVKMDGKFTLNPLKKIGEAPFAAAAVGATGAMIGGAAANVYSGFKNNKGFKGKMAAIGSGFAGGASGFFRGGYAGATGKGKDNVLKAAQAGIKGTVDRRNLRDQREAAGDGGIKGTIRRAGVGLQNMAGVESGASKFDKQVSAYDEFLKEHSSLDSYVEGEINKGKLVGNTNFTWTNIAGQQMTSSGNVNVLKNQVQSLRASGASATAITNAELAYQAALSQAKQDYISMNQATDGAIQSALSNLNYIRETNSGYAGFDSMGQITSGADWDKAKKAIKSNRGNVTSSVEYRQAQVNRRNDPKK